MPNLRLASALTLPLVFTLQGCLATLPDIVNTGDSDIFKAERPLNEQEARGCGTHLNSLRSSAKTNNYLRLGTTIAAGSVTTVSSYLVATKDDGESAKTEAIVALVGGLVTILAQAIPDPTGALDDHRKAQSSWNEARRRVANGAPADDGTIFGLLNDCRNNKPYEAAPGLGNAPKPPAPAQPEGAAPHAAAAAAAPARPAAAWYGFAQSKNKDREAELKNKCDANFQRVEVPEGTKTFTGLCTSLGMRCEKACDWEGKSVGCDDLPNPQWSGDGADGSRVAHCVP